MVVMMAVVMMNVCGCSLGGVGGTDGRCSNITAAMASRWLSLPSACNF